MPAAYTVNRGAVAELLFGRSNNPADIVSIYHDLNRRAESVQRRARVLVGKKSGHLAARITLTSRAAPPFWWFTITGDTRYSYYHHRGTKPHIIVGEMKFREHGKTVYATTVHHPGIKPNPFLRNALPAFMAARDSATLRP